MASRSIGELNVKVTANAEQLVQQMNRADASVRGAVTKMDRELGRFANSMARKFSLGDIGKDILRGLGIGSGFAVAQQAAELLSDHYRKAAEAAKEIEESTARQLDLVQQMIAARQTEPQRIAAIDAQLARMEAQRAALLRSVTTESYMPTMTGSVQRVTKTTGPSAEAMQQAQAIAEQMQKLALDRQKLAESVAKAEVKTVEDAGQLILEIDTANFEARAKIARAWADQQRQEADDEIAYQMDLYRAESEMTESWMKRMAESSAANVQSLHDAIFDGVDSLGDKIAARNEAFAESMGNMFGDIANNASSAFAEMVLTGENAFKALPQMAARAALEIVARMAIINPLMNALFGGFSGFQILPAFFGAGAAAPTGRASGGNAAAGAVHRVNERGPELLSVGGSDFLMMGSRSGYVTGNDKLGGGNTYIFNLPGGVSESVFGQFAQAVQAALGPGAIERRAIAAVTDRNFRTA